MNPTLKEIASVTEGNAVDFPKFLEVVGTGKNSLPPSLPTRGCWLFAVDWCIPFDAYAKKPSGLFAAII